MKKVLNKIWIEPFHDLNNRIDTGQPTIHIDGKVLANEVHILDKNGDGEIDYKEFFSKFTRTGEV